MSAGSTIVGRSTMVAVAVVFASLAAPGCGTGSAAGSGDTTGTDGPNTATDPDTDDASTSPASTGSDSSGSGGAQESGSSSTGGGDASEAGSGTGGRGPAEDGHSCTSPRGCLSGACYDAGILGGICGACAASADCEAGCHPPHPFTDPRGPSVCEPNNDDGSACETASDCGGGSVCATIFVLPGVFDVRGCGGCESAKDCARGESCSPTYDLLGLGGTRSCTAPGTLADGAHCDPQNGAEACLNACRSVEFEGLATVGVCSICGNDGDCMPDTEMCAPPLLVDGELQPATCVPVKMPRSPSEGATPGA